MGSALQADPRLGKPWPACDLPVVYLRLDFGLGAIFENQGIAAGVPGDGVPWNSGNAAALLRAVARIRKINDDPTDPREYEVHTIWTGYCRNIANTNSPSYHSLWAAIDVNPQENYRGIAGDIPEWVNDCFRAEGFEAGDDWGYSDPMHFENGRFYAAWDGTYPEEDDVNERDIDAFSADVAEALARKAAGTLTKTDGKPWTGAIPKTGEAGYNEYVANKAKYKGLWEALGRSRGTRASA